MVENSKKRRNIVLGRLAVFIGTLIVLFLVCKFLGMENENGRNEGKNAV